MLSPIINIKFKKKELTAPVWPPVIDVEITTTMESKETAKDIETAIRLMSKNYEVKEVL